MILNKYIIFRAITAFIVTLGIFTFPLAEDIHAGAADCNPACPGTHECVQTGNTFHCEPLCISTRPYCFPSCGSAEVCRYVSGNTCQCQTPQSPDPHTNPVNPINDVFGRIQPPPGANRFGSGNVQTGLIPFINTILRLIFIVAGLWAFFNILFAGFMFMQAGGDPKAIGNAWGRIWQSFVGLLILTSSFLIAAIIGIVMFGSPTAILRPVLTGAP